MPEHQWINCWRNIRMANKQSRWSNIWPPVVTLLFIGIVWELIVRMKLVYSWLIPSPIGVFKGMIADWPRLMEHLAATTKLSLIGFAGGAIAGFVLAAVLHFLPVVRKGLYPVLILSQTIPVIVIAPILTMLLGYGMMPKIFLIILVCFFPICIATLGGLAQADHQLKNYLGMIGASKWHLFIHLELPSALTNLFGGLRIAVSYSVLSAVVAEWLSPKVGLGSYLILSSRGYMPDRVFASVLLIVLMSLLLFWIVSFVESRFVHWRPKKGSQG